MVANRIDDPEKLSLVCQLVDLATSLRQERLFVISEQTHLQQLNVNVSNLHKKMILNSILITFYVFISPFLH